MYNHKEIEGEMAEFWEKNKIYEKVKEKNKNGKRFYFCDGPPYATGEIHPGTAWNKTIKDAVCRYWRARGMNVRAQAGYDTHGLPIEVKVEQELKFRHKNEIEDYGIGKFIEKCKAFATKYIGVMGKQFMSVGVWMDFDEPYVTYRDEYIESSWTTLKSAYDKGLMHEGMYVLPYCHRCETTLANYELEYGEETDPSIFVKFKVKDKEDDYLIIWTTTPWTLVANMAVMAHPTHKYAKLRVDDENWIVAKERVDYVLEKTGKSGTIIEEIPGRKLKDIMYGHPFQKEIKKEYERRVVLSDEFVTLEEGTGLVHCAPGHGPEDFIIGKRFEIEAFCPVDGSGCYTEDAGGLKGKNVRAANPDVIKILKKEGALLAEERIKHRYPHCWRCKNPLIFITTKQWFITVSKLKDKMLAEIDNTEWHPEFAKDRFREFVKGAPDWCISRQRYWGIPLPIWKCGSCGEVRVVDSRKDLPETGELHRPYVDRIMLKCVCGGEMKRVPDVLDVWFDSGNAVWASLKDKERKEYGEKTDLIIEGQDQIRGWFYSLLGSGMIKYGGCPYKKLLMHGFFVDEHGEKMSKSLGNFVPLEEIVRKYGADAFRLWGMSSTIWDELKFNPEELKKCYSDLNIIFNMSQFLQRFHPKKKIGDVKYEALDSWLLSRLNSTVKGYRNAMENYELNRATKRLRRFAVDDLSRFYMKIAKERISKGKNAEAALSAIYISLLEILKMMTPFSPFISEHIYRSFFMKHEKEKSVSFLELGTEDERRINILSEKQVEMIKGIASSGLLARQSANIKLRWPVRAVYIETKSHEITDAVNAFSGIVLSLLNAKSVEIIDSTPKGDVATAPIESGKVHIMKKLDSELYEEGMANEVKRRIQNMRKKMGLVEKDAIVVHLSAEDEIEEIVKKNKKELSREINARKIEFSPLKNMDEYQIDGRIVRIKLESS